jgi:phage regulator Rha-like protein
MNQLENQISIIPPERIARKIFWLRGQKVMLDSDLAELYQVPTKRLNESVKRNIERFPSDFMFQLTPQEEGILRSQFATSNEVGTQKSQDSRGGRRYNTYAFTEQGVAMLSSVLRSPRAVQINIHIIRVFTQLREMLLTHKDLRDKIERMERKYDKQFRAVFEVIKQMIDEKESEPPREKIGFQIPEEKKKKRGVAKKNTEKK